MWARCSLGHRHWGRNGAAGLLLADAGRLLLQLRANSQHAGTWSIPGGAREWGETSADTALREAWEECGIPPPAVIPTGSHDAYCGGWSYVTILGRLSTPAAELRCNGEGRAEWVDVAEVETLPLHPAFAEAWPALRRLL